MKSAFNTLGDPLRVEVGWNSPFGIPTTDQHLIPRALTARIKQRLPSYNENAPRNMLEVPFDHEDARVSNLATQRGGHKPYNDYMEEKVDDTLKKYDASQSTSSPITQEELAETIGELQDTMRCRHNRTKSDIAPNQLKLHKDDPNADMVSGLNTSAEEVEAMIASAQYTQRLHKHNLAYNPGYAALTEQAADPTALPSSRLKQAPIAEETAIFDMDGDDKSCGRAITSTPAEATFIEKVESAIVHAPTIDQETGYKMIAAGAMLAGGALAVEALGTSAVTESVVVKAAANDAVKEVTQKAAATVIVASPLSSTTRIVSPDEAVPSLDQMHKSGGDIMGGRSHVNQIAIRFVGDNATPEALYESAMEKHYTHAQGHLLLQKDGTLLRDDRLMRPYDENPQIAAGRNADTLGIMVEGKSLTDAQRGTLTQVQDTFSARLANSAYGATQGAQLFGATYDEQNSLTQPQIAPHMLPQPARRPNLSAGMGG